MSNIRVQKGLYWGVLVILVSACGTGVRDSQNNLPPEARDVSIALEGDVTTAYVGSKLIGKYKYTDPENDSEGATELRWLREGQPIAGATGEKYTVVADDSGKSIQFQVTPKDVKSDIASTAVVSAGIKIENSAPTASNVRITLAYQETALQQGYSKNALIVRFDYLDRDNDAMDPAIELKWLNSENTLLGTDATYVVKPSDVGKIVHAEITYKAQTGDQTTNTAITNNVAIFNSAPVASDLTITRKPSTLAVGTELTAHYTFYDADDEPENGSVITWMRTIGADTKPLRRGNTYTLDTTDTNVGAVIYFTVEPKNSLSGTLVTSTGVSATNSAPEANNVNILVNASKSTTAHVKDELVGDYTYFDADGNQEADPVNRRYAWYVSDAGTGPGMNRTTVGVNQKYTVKQGDSGKFLYFEITPIALDGAVTVGTPVLSAPVHIDNSPPTVTSATLSAPQGSNVGNLLSVIYTFEDVDGDAESGSTLQWLRIGANKAVTPLGTVNDSKSDTPYTYKLVADDTQAGATLVVEITPKSNNTLGTAKRSNSLAANNQAPVASNVKINPDTATAKVGSKLTAAFDYADADTDQPDPAKHEYTWRRIDPTTRTSVVIGTTPANTATYTLAKVDAHKKITVSVKPAALTGTSPGAEVPSAELTVENSAPSIAQVSITGIQNINKNLTATYTTFSDPDGDTDASTFQWNRTNTAGTVSIGTAKDYTLVKDDIGASITVTVTPKDDHNGVGAAVTSAAVIPANLPPQINGTFSVVAANTQNTNKPGAQLSYLSNFTITDPEQDQLGASKYQWYRGTTPIQNETQSTYLLTLADIGQSISLQIQPTATSGTSPGVAVASSNTVDVPLLSSITLSPASLTVEKGQTSTPIGATGTFSDNNSVVLSNGQLQWDSDAPGVATVSQAGAVKGLSGGSAKVTASYGALKSSNFVAVTVAAHSISGTVSGWITAGVNINLTGQETASTITTADANGNGIFSFAGLANGTYTVTPTKLGLQFTPTSASVTISSGNISGVNFTDVAGLNDTGITNKQCFESNNTTSLVDCATTTLSYGQDGMLGRDANAATNSDANGKLGFSFTAVAGGCVLDNVTGLMWEVKTNDAVPGLRDWTKTYTNYDSTTALQKYVGATNTYVAPTQAEIDAATNSVGFKNAVNASGLCGFNDWRLPTADELQSLVDYGVAYPGPTIDAAWYPNTQGSIFWSASPSVGDAGYAWSVNFHNGSVYGSSRSNSDYVRLVRAGQ